MSEGLQNLLRSEHVDFQSTERGATVFIKRQFGTYELRCTPFEEGVRVQLWLPADGSVKIDAVNGLCKTLQDSITGLEFGFYPDEGQFCAAAFLRLEEGLGGNLNLIASICEQLRPVFTAGATGAALHPQAVRLALMPTNQMFRA